MKVLAILLAALVLVTSAASRQGTTPNIKEVFIGRCWDYQEIRYNTILPIEQKNCSHLWDLFFKAFSYHAPCDVRQVNYDQYLQEAKQSLPANKALFWSGIYNLAHQFSDNGINYVTLEDTLIGYLANSLTWCGQENYPGMNFSACPTWTDCPLEASESFWSGASTTFAAAAIGPVVLMVDGSNPNKPAYRRDSFFGKYELPGLNVSKVPSVQVIVTHALGAVKLEVCGNGTLVTLQNDIEARGMTYTCDDNPDSVMYLLCAEKPDCRECKLAKALASGQLSYNSTVITPDYIMG
ncbi:ADP-ribosyl cyclase/cyclic ADP-ribose hydrolase [Biomphalaria pfeifferi]|uniref:ADP-ribosyl cyclase/cyclic ADP-ribose hydrolase n=1 Tax=Biomphalaria pfeifferi TaxID=112525 RepID=A0AAD8C3B5_BIOPF|nr:ADP-ribosyl cyclase/cyclic ADP-ribose hydrolase [Biomphalaria pfeifferi]